ncbi:fluoride efflux transporter FluC, partial [Streptomyces bottropensis]|uniref:fluoride efflux transporter FluC n=1 Tax=Streptomyces bottropensis TaxID=42235 RepID=UPI0036AE290B
RALPPPSARGGPGAQTVGGPGDPPPPPGAAAPPPPDSHLRLLLGTGLCGALTTYSTFSYETLRLAQDGARPLAVANVVASVTAGLGAVFVGLAVARALWA